MKPMIIQELREKVKNFTLFELDAIYECESCGKDAEFKCEECGEHYCDDCLQPHTYMVPCEKTICKDCFSLGTIKTPF